MPWSPLTTPDGPQRRVHRVGEALDQVLASLGAPPADSFSAVVSAWPDLVGPEAAQALEPIAIEQRRLLVRTAEPAWASQVRWLAPAILAAAAARLGEGVIDEVVVRVDRNWAP
ncbi:MAG: DUF721 domain-containing protein [Actinobacteria bacterium]|nr:DUF721 domain-containing protein [Actinomycetota bacterium]